MHRNLTILVLMLGLVARATGQPSMVMAPPGEEEISSAQEVSTPLSDESQAPSAKAATSVTAEEYYYALATSIAFATPDSSNPYVQIAAREPVRLVGIAGEWVEVRTGDGARGFVRRGVISNLWIRVSKKSKTVWVYHGPELAATIAADMAYNFFLDKERRGSRLQPDHWRTPEGLYYVVAKNPASRFYKALVLNYPSLKDGKAGLQEGLISEGDYLAIAEADQKHLPPPMDTALGGWIEIHGQGSGSRTTWTRGCVAIPNEALDELWEIVHVGTPVLIES